MQDARGMKRAERADQLVAKQCRCGRWFTIRGRRDHDQCFRCDYQEGQASEQ